MAEPRGSKTRSPLGWFLPGSLKMPGANAEENMNQQPGQGDSTLKSETGTEGQIGDSWGHQSDVFLQCLHPIVNTWDLATRRER